MPCANVRSSGQGLRSTRKISCASLGCFSEPEKSPVGPGSYRVGTWPSILTKKGGEKMVGLNEALEIITKRRWKSYANELYKRNMERHGQSLTACSISEKVCHLIVQRQKGGTMLVRAGWRSAMEKAAEVKSGN